MPDPRPAVGCPASRRAWLPLVALGLAASFSPLPARAADLVRGVRLKISAGDLRSAEAAVEDYRRATGVDTEYLAAVGWLARGAEMLRRPERADRYVAELRTRIPVETPETAGPLGAAIEVEGKLRAAREGRGAAVRFLEGELAKAKDPALRSRIRKNVNLLTLEGTPAPDLPFPAAPGSPSRLSELKGKPVLLFFWAAWCGDCKDQAASLVRVAAKYRPRGLAVVAPTKLYGWSPDGKEPAPDEERAAVAKAFAETFAGLDGVPVPVDAETMLRWGVSATPTFALVDRAGVVRLYTPTRLSEEELSRRIEELLAEPS